MMSMFVLIRLDYAEVEDQGEVVAIVHSHPTTNPIAITADQVACEKHGLPWFIVNPNTEGWGYCEPSGFKLPYVGREFCFGVNDCYTLCRDWYAREWGHPLRDYDRREQVVGARRKPVFRELGCEGFRKIPVEEVQRGDLLLMQSVFSRCQIMQRSTWVTSWCCIMFRAGCLAAMFTAVIIGRTLPAP